MPELPEVETVRRGLEPALVDRPLARVVVRRRDLRRPLPDDFEARLTGRRVAALRRRAKYLLMDLDSGDSLIAHLGMSGRFRIFEAGTAPEPEPHDHVLFETDRGVSVRFNDPRRFGLMDLARSEDLEAHPLLAGLGPEPLGNAFSGPVLAARLAGRRGPIKTALLDQAVVAGLGNIYVCEALFRAGLSPLRGTATITGRRAERLAGAIREVLNEAIAAGGSSLRDHRQPSGELGYFQHRFAVYGRAGAACPGCDCDPSASGGIRRLVQGGRSTFYCARRQR
jgi:formamidopyrimidine-DNA glycosylase